MSDDELESDVSGSRLKHFKKVWKDRWTRPTVAVRRPSNVIPSPPHRIHRRASKRPPLMVDMLKVDLDFI